jgi:hypothetical protein
MKRIAILIIIGLVVGISMLYIPNTVTVVQENVMNETVTKEEEPVVAPDVVEQARKELERITAELDLEESTLLADVEAINAVAEAEVQKIEAEAAAKVAEKKARLESIRETRSSFQ